MLVRIPAVGLLVLLVSAPESKSVQRELAEKIALVDHIADGDTIAVRIGGRAENVRLIGIDTPRGLLRGRVRRPEGVGVDEADGRPGDPVTLIHDRTQANRDRYDRLLRYVQVRGRDLGRKRVRKGWALR